MSFFLYLSTILVLRAFLLLFFIFAFVPEKRVLFAGEVLGGSVTCFFLFCICRQFCIFVFAIVPERGSYWQSRCWAVGGNNSRRGRRRPGARNLVRPRKPAHCVTVCDNVIMLQGYSVFVTEIRHNVVQNQAFLFLLTSSKDVLQSCPGREFLG